MAKRGLSTFRFSNCYFVLIRRIFFLFFLCNSCSNPKLIFVLSASSKDLASAPSVSYTFDGFSNSSSIKSKFSTIMDVYEAFLLRRAGQYAHCTLDTCPVSDSLYGYLPSKPVNMILVAIFALSCLVHLIQGVKNRCWTFLVCFGIGTAAEAVGE